MPALRFACTALGLDRERLAFWLAAGCGLVLADGVWRLERPRVLGARRGPSPCPVPEALARDAIARGAPARRPGDLFGVAAE